MLALRAVDPGGRGGATSSQAVVPNVDKPQGGPSRADGFTETVGATGWVRLVWLPAGRWTRTSESGAWTRVGWPCGISGH